jgi:hypothetical protein
MNLPATRRPRQSEASSGEQSGSGAPRKIWRLRPPIILGMLSTALALTWVGASNCYWSFDFSREKPTDGRIYEYTLCDGRDAEYKDGRSAGANYFSTLALLGSSSRPKLTSLVARGQSAAPGRAGAAAPSFAVVHSRPPRAKCVAGEAEPCFAVLAGDRERSGGLRTSRRPSLLFRGRFAGERGRRCRQDFPLGRKPMLIGSAVHEAICAPDLEGALANAVFEGLIHVNVRIWLMMTLLHLPAELTTG